MAFGEERLELPIFDEAIGLVVALPLLVLNDADLVGEVLLRHRAEQVPHAIALQEQSALQRRGRHRLEIIGAIEPGGAVIIRCADLLQRLEEIAGRVFRTVEHQMLEEVGEAGAALGLILGADMIPDGDGDDRRFAVLVHDNAQAVGKRELLVGNVDLPDQLRDGRRPGAAGRHGRGRCSGRRRVGGSVSAVHRRACGQR